VKSKELPSLPLCFFLLWQLMLLFAQNSPLKKKEELQRVVIAQGEEE
jgi:hypothetical protein